MNHLSDPTPISGVPQRGNVLWRIWRFYINGFRSMTVGRVLWVIILIKLFVLFFVFKLLFFPDVLERDYPTDAERAQAVRSALLDDNRN